MALLNESLLVRDTLYLMQGISGKYVRFAISQASDKTLVFTSDPVYILSKNKSLLQMNVELSLESSNIAFNASPCTPIG